MVPDASDWGYTNYGSLGFYSLVANRKFGLVVGVDFDGSSGSSPVNWTSYLGGAATGELTDLVSEAGYLTAYDLTISTTGTSLETFTSQNPIDSAQLPNHSLPLDELGGYLTAEDGETLTFVWSDLDPGTVYQIFVFGHADISVQNEVTVTGGYWNGVAEQTYNFTQTIGADGMAVNGDNQTGGEDLSTLGLLVISNELGEITINVTNADGEVVGIAGVAITVTKIGSLQGQKWNDNGGGVPTEAGDGGGSADPGEEGLPGWQIYLDLNNNGVLDMESTPNQTITKHAPEVPQTIADYATVKNELVLGVADFGGSVGPILDVNVKFSITHGYVGDLNVYLIAPDGTRVQLVKDKGGNGDNFTNTKFDDAAATSINAATVVAPFTGTYQPQFPLSVLNGKDPIGKWTLEIQDDAIGFAGILTDWSIEIEVEGSTSILEPFQITDSEGNYSFEALKAGVYYVREHIQEQQSIDGWRQSWAPPPVLVTSGGDITGVDFGNWIPIFSPGAVAGQVWNDINDDGDKDANEPGLENWTVYIDANENRIRDVGTVPVIAEAASLPKAITDFSTVTSEIKVVDDLGAVLDIEVTLDITHSFMADVEAFLTSPSGRIVELFSGVGAQFNNFDDLTFSDDAARSITTIGQADLPYTGTWRPEAPLATFFGDNAKGTWTLTIRDTTFADEGTLNSWSLAVTTGERFAVTDGDGNYQFDNIPPGQYIIREELQTGWQQTLTPGILDDGFGNLVYDVSVTAGNTVLANFGNQAAPGSIQGNKFNDLDGNGVKDGSDTGLSGWTIYLDANDNGSLDNDALVTESATGLPIPIPDGSDDFPSVPSTITSQITVTSSLSITDINVTIDVSHSFVQDLEIFLISPWGERIELATQVGGAADANFTNTTFDDQAEPSITTGSQPFTGSFSPEGLLADLNGENSLGIWTLEISDTEFDDVGTLNSWSLAIRGGEQSTITDTNGDYSFTDLAAGDYIVREVLQPDWVQTAPSIPNGQDHWAVTIGPGEDATGRNFGNRFAAAPELPGDFNRDSFVNAADYVVFRKLQGTAAANEYDGADGSGNGSVGPEDLTVWEQNFGRAFAGGGGGGAESASESSSGGMEAASESSFAESAYAPAASTLSVPTEQSAAFESISAVESKEQQVSASSSYGTVYSLMASSTRSVGSSSNAESSQASAESTVDAALVALLKSQDDASGRLDNYLASSGDAFDGLEDDDLTGEYGDAAEGIDALFELIGA